MNQTLSFAKGNAKLDGNTYIFSLPAGHSCPAASLCQSKADKLTGKIIDGPNSKFRCFATIPEMLFPNVRLSRWNNFELIKQAKTTIGMANLIESALLPKKNIKLVRLHGSGDFFNQTYFDAWVLVAQQHKDWIFYGYTKMLPLWIKRLNDIPANMKLVASEGGLHDNLIRMFGLRSAKVVFSENEARQLNLDIDHDDSLVWRGNKDFCLVLHGSQPAKTEASKAWHQISKHGKGGYKSDYFKTKTKTVTVPAVKVTFKTDGLRMAIMRNKAGTIKIHPPTVKLSNAFLSDVYDGQ
jgi:hypothetical protein